MKKVLKEKSGITLIALVITIIVLLILAGVSIAMLTGDNGILTQATEAKKANIVGEEKEQIGLAMQSLKTKKQEDNVTVLGYSDISYISLSQLFPESSISQLFPGSSTFPKESLSILTQTFFIRTIFFLFLLQDTRLDCLVE